MTEKVTEKVAEKGERLNKKAHRHFMQLRVQ